MTTPIEQSRRPADARVADVSVVIPVLNDAALLNRCLDALGRQTVFPAEVIVVDNGSTDETAAVAARHGVRLVREPGPGIPAAASRGYDEARCGLIARLDADSLPGRTWVGRAEHYLAVHPDVAAITGFALFLDAPRGLRRLGGAVYLGAYFVCAGAALGHAPVFGSNFVMRREAWEAVTGQVHRDDRMVHDDMDLSMHLGANHRIRVLPSLAVGISARPFTDGRWALRMRRGFHSIVLHWPEELPWRRYFRRRMVRP